MRLIGQHELGQHDLVAAHGTRVLVLHDTSPVNVEARNQDVLYMLLATRRRVLRLDGPGTRLWLRH
jgi:hypothetical protein